MPVSPKTTHNPDRSRQTDFRQRSLLAAITDAARGFWGVWLTERSMRIHVVLGSGVVLAGIVTGLQPAEWVAVSSAIAAVVFAEIFNTAVEAAVDLASPRYHPLAGRAKDTAAAAVFTAALYAIGVGLVVFGSHRALWLDPAELRAAWHTHRLAAAAMATLTAALALAGTFVPRGQWPQKPRSR